MGNGAFETREMPERQLFETEVLVKVGACGVCGTDVHIYHGDKGSAEVGPPVVLGHELSGTIVETGAGVKKLKCGDRVAIDPNQYCGECHYCKAGKKQLCENLYAIGVNRDGGFAEYCYVPEAQCFLLDNRVPLEHGAMAEPLACCIHGVDRAKIRLGDTVLVIGGGAIGLEMAENLTKLGVRSSIIDMAEHVLPGYDGDFAAFAENELADHGIPTFLNDAITSFEGEGRVQKVRTGKRAIKTDMVIMSIGVRPNTDMFTDPRLKKFKNGAIIVTDAMETDIPDVYAAGDCATLYNAVTGRLDYIALGTTANKQGRLAADAMLGEEVHYNRAIGTSILRVMDLEMGKTGVSEREAKECGFDYGTATVQSISHSPYYTCPPPYLLTAKIVYDKKTKVILGAQIMGEREAAMRINIFACAVDRKMTTEELGMLDMAYSPSVTYIWDIVHVVANAAK